MIAFDDTNPPEEFVFGLYNIDGRLVAQKPNHFRFRYKEHFPVTHLLRSSHTKMGEGILFKEFHNDTLFLITENTWQPYLILDPGNLGYTTGMRSENKDPSESITINRLLWTEETTIVRFASKASGRQLLLISNKSGDWKSVHLDSSTLNEFDRILLSGIRPISGDRFFAVVNSRDLMRLSNENGEVNRLLKTSESVLNETSNPVIIIFMFRDLN